MATQGLITELDVVNSVLSVAGDNPISALSDSYQPAFIIRQMINNVSRDMQTKKLWFNTDFNVTLTSNTETDRITLPFNLLQFDPQNCKYVARGLTVYNKEDRTNTITEDIIADIAVMLTFEELPQVARSYIQSKCRQQYNDEYFGETSLKQSLEREVTQASNDLMEAHLTNENINILNSPRASSIAFRNRRR